MFFFRLQVVAGSKFVIHETDPGPDQNTTEPSYFKHFPPTHVAHNTSFIYYKKHGNIGYNCYK